MVVSSVGKKTVRVPTHINIKQRKIKYSEFTGEQVHNICSQVTYPSRDSLDKNSLRFITHFEKLQDCFQDSGFVKGVDEVVKELDTLTTLWFLKAKKFSIERTLGKIEKLTENTEGLSEETLADCIIEKAILLGTSQKREKALAVCDMAIVIFRENPDIACSFIREKAVTLSNMEGREHEVIPLLEETRENYADKIQASTKASLYRVWVAKVNKQNLHGEIINISGEVLQDPEQVDSDTLRFFNLAMGEAFSSLGRGDAAVPYLQTAISLMNPKLDSEYKRLSEAYDRLTKGFSHSKKHAEAISTAREAMNKLHTYPDLIRRHRKNLMLNLRKAFPERVLEQLETIIAEEKQTTVSVSLACKKGYLLLSQEEPEQALNFLHELIENIKKDEQVHKLLLSDSYSAIIYALEALGRNEEIKATVKEAAEALSSSKEALKDFKKLIRDEYVKFMPEIKREPVRAPILKKKSK